MTVGSIVQGWSSQLRGFHKQEDQWDGKQEFEVADPASVLWLAQKPECKNQYRRCKKSDGCDCSEKICFSQHGRAFFQERFGSSGNLFLFAFRAFGTMRQSSLSIPPESTLTAVSEECLAQKTIQAAALGYFRAFPIDFRVAAAIKDLLSPRKGSPVPGH